MKVCRNCHLNQKTGRTCMVCRKSLLNFSHVTLSFTVCTHACILYFLFGSCCQDVSSFGSTCQDVSSFSRGAIYMHTFYFIFYLVLAAKMYHLSIAPAKMFHLSIGEPYACILYHIHVSFVFCMAAVAIIISYRCDHKIDVHCRN